MGDSMQNQVSISGISNRRIALEVAVLAARAFAIGLAISVIAVIFVVLLVEITAMHS
jgi:hypothetical protein